jgi:hypothetical protein
MRLGQDLTLVEAEAKRYGVAIGNGAGKLEMLITALAVAEARRDRQQREVAETESPSVFGCMSDERAAGTASH